MRKVSFHQILSGIWKLFVRGPNGKKVLKLENKQVVQHPVRIRLFLIEIPIPKISLSESKM